MNTPTNTAAKTITLAKFLEAVKFAEHTAMSPCSGVAYGINKEFVEKWATESLQRADRCRQPLHISIHKGGSLVMCGVPSTDTGAMEVVP